MDTLVFPAYHHIAAHKATLFNNLAPHEVQRLINVAPTITDAIEEGYYE